MNSLHDPYLTTVKRSFDEQRIIERKKRLKLKKENVKQESYFSKTINLNQILDLPEGLQQIVFFIFFLLIPYTVGLIFVFVIRLNMICLDSQKVNEFLFFWTIGYEFLATILLLVVIQQSLTYRRSP